VIPNNIKYRLNLYYQQANCTNLLENKPCNTNSSSSTPLLGVREPQCPVAKPSVTDGKTCSHRFALWDMGKERLFKHRRSGTTVQHSETEECAAQTPSTLAEWVGRTANTWEPQTWNVHVWRKCACVKKGGCFSSFLILTTDRGGLFSKTGLSSLWLCDFMHERLGSL
jgi:hypothetical protein